MKNRHEPKYSEKQITQAIRDKYNNGRTVVLGQTHIRLGEGGGSQVPDALALDYSDDLIITGFEIKRTREDWLVERRNPMKSAGVLRMCNFWYAVASDKDVIERTELPEGWGLYRMTDIATLECVAAAPRLKPEPMSRSMAAVVVSMAMAIASENVEESSYWKGYAKGLSACLKLSDSSPFRRATDFESKVAAAAEFLAERKDFSALMHFHQLRRCVAQIYKSVEEIAGKVGSVSDWRDWQTGKGVPPDIDKMIMETVRRTPEMQKLLHDHPESTDAFLQAWAQRYFL